LECYIHLEDTIKVYYVSVRWLLGDRSDLQVDIWTSINKDRTGYDAVTV